MKARLRKLLTRIASPLLRWLLRHRPVILMFHGFTSREHLGSENCQHKHLHVEKLDAFLAFLKRYYHITSLDEIAHCLQHGRPLPQRAVVLTFDDGFLSNYTIAYRLLQRHQASATIYLATEFVDEHKPIWTDRVDYAFTAAGKGPGELRAAKQRLKQLPQENIDDAVTELEDALGARLKQSNDPGIPDIYHGLNWDQVREMHGTGLVQFGAHTHTHKILGRCEPETVRLELQTSKSIIERELAAPCLHFCYPNGSHGDFSALTEQYVHEAGFHSSVTTLNGRLRPKPQAFLLPRLGITNDLDIERFDLLLAGVNTMADQLRKWASSFRR